MALVNTLAIRLEAITSGFSSAFDKAAGTVNQLAGKFDNLNKKTGEAKSRADELTRNFTKLDNITSSIGTAFDSVAAASAGAGEGLGEFGDVTDDVLNNARALEASIREFAGGLETELAGIAGKAAPAAEGLFKIAEEAAAIGPKGLPVIDKIIAKLEELNRVPGKSAGAFDVTITAIRKLRTEAEAVGKPISTLTKFTNAFIGTVRNGESAVAAFARENRSLGQVFKNTTQFISSLNPVAAISVAVIGLLGAGLVRAVKHAIAFADVIAAVSKQTGFATEFLSQMKFVVEQNGSSFDAAQTALKTFNRNLGEAVQGSAGAVKAFKRLGVSQDELRKLSPEQVLERVQDSLKGTESAAIRTARGFALFGRGADEFVGVMALGSEAIKAQRLEADRLGHTISGNLARAADEFGDNLGKLRTLGTGLAIQLAEKVVPAFNDLLVTVIPLAARAIPLLAGSLSGLAFALSKVEALATLASVALLRFQNLGKGKLPAGVIIKGFTENAAADAAQLAFLEQEAKRAKEQLFQTKEAFDAASKAALENVPITKAAGEGFAELEAQLKTLSDELEGTFSRLAGQADPRASGLVELAKQFATLGPKGREGIRAIITEFEKLNAAGQETAGEFTVTIQKLKEIAAQATPLAGLTTEAGRLAERLEGGASAATAAASALLEIGTPKAIQQFNAQVAALTRLAAAGDDAAGRVAKVLTALEGPQIDAAELERRRLAQFQGPSGDAATRAGDPFAVGAPIDARTRAFREEELRRQQFDVGPELPPNLERIPTIFGEIVLATDEAKAGFAALENFAGGIGDALAESAFGGKKAFADFFKAVLKQIAALIAKAIVLQTILSFLPTGGGFFGGLGRLLGGGKSAPAETPGLDSLLQSEGARFGNLFGRGLRSTLGQTAFAGIGANPGTAQVVIEPQIVVQNAGPLARVEWFEKGQEQRLRRRQEELGGAPL